MTDSLAGRHLIGGKAHRLRRGVVQQPSPIEPGRGSSALPLADRRRTSKQAFAAARARRYPAWLPHQPAIFCRGTVFDKLAFRYPHATPNDLSRLDGPASGGKVP